MHDGETGAGNDGNLVRAGLPVTPAIGTDLVDVEIMMGVLDGGDAVAARRQFGDDTHRKACFARVLPAGNAKDLLYRHGSMLSR
ncbi:hypothetical protein D3C78_1509220 [compost metagenome]